MILYQPDDFRKAGSPLEMMSVSVVSKVCWEGGIQHHPGATPCHRPALPKASIPEPSRPCKRLQPFRTERQWLGSSLGLLSDLDPERERVRTKG